MSARGSAACWLTAGVVYLSLEAVAARAVPGYGYAHDFISDLGRPDSPRSNLMNAAFVTQGTLFFAGAVFAVRAAQHRRAGPFIGLAAANAVGNLLVASVPSGPSGLAWVHVTGAVIAIVGGNAAILAGWPVVSDGGVSRYYRHASVALGAVGLTSFALLAIESTGAVTTLLPGAVWERTSVYTIIGWQILSAILLLLDRRRHS